jgi:hypothetical protein
MSEQSAEEQQGSSGKKVVGRPFKKGQSGNPDGRPPSVKRIPEILKAIGEENAGLKGADKQDWTKLDALMRAVYSYALAGKPWAMHFVAERTEGKVTDTHEIVGQIPIAMEVIVTKKKADDSDS